MAGLREEDVTPGDWVMLTMYRLAMQVVALETRYGRPGAHCQVHGYTRWFPLSNLSESEPST